MAPHQSVRWLVDEIGYRSGRTKNVEMRPGWTITCHAGAWRLAYQLPSTDPAQIAELDAFIGSCEPGMVLFDIGAHFGMFSLAALHYGGHRARAFAIDPAPMAVQMTALQARLNSCADRLTLIPKAVSDRSSPQRLVAAGIRAAGYLVPPAQHHTAQDLTEVPTTTIDALVETLGIVPTHVKIDVEGHEAAVIRGGARTLSASHAPILFIELHHRLIAGLGGDPHEALRLLRDLGYEFHVCDNSVPDQASLTDAPLVRVRAQKAGVDFAKGRCSH
jgi:FkbM family methyltransferase